MSAINNGQFSHSLIQSILYNSLQPTQRRSFLYIISFLKQMIKLHDEKLRVKSPRPSDAYPLSEPRQSISVSDGTQSVELVTRDTDTVTKAKESETISLNSNDHVVAESVANEKTVQSDNDSNGSDKDDTMETIKQLSQIMEEKITTIDQGEISRSEQESESMVALTNNESAEESEERITLEQEFGNFLADFESKYEELFRKSFTTDDYSSLLQEIEHKLDADFEATTTDSFDLVEISNLFSESLFQISTQMEQTVNAIST